MMTVTEITQIGTLFLASVAGYLSLRTFRRNKKQELENHLFKTKLDAFSNIAYELDNFFITLNRAIVRLNEYKSGEEHERYEELQRLSIEIDEQIYKCHSLIVKYSVYFSKKSIDSLLAFTDNLIGDDENSGESVDIMKWIDEYYTKQVDTSNKAIEVLRDELQLEKLHHSLYNRSMK